jgi:hydroxyacylglutathione hydrolase
MSAMEPVQIDRFYLGCLAHASYLVHSQGVAAIIDPQRDVDLYIEAAAAKGLRIAHIVSGHLELAKRTGGQIYIGAGSEAAFDHIAVRDGDRVEFGNCRLEFLQTPGHTIESVCILMTDTAQPERPQAVFTGDTLFVGDVGRPDLSGTYTPQELAAMLYQSLWTKLMPLPDVTEVHPAHGAGSLCGRQMSSESCSTIGKEKRYNYALQAKDCDEFIHLLTDNLPPRPEYFAREVEKNRQGAASLAELPSLQPLSPDEVLRMQSEGAMVVDTRPAMQFAVAHVPGSVHIALTGQYASWAARILGLDTRLIIAGEDPDHIRESQMRLARVGVENVVGYLDGGITAWIQSGRELEYIPQLSPVEFAEMLEAEGPDGIAVVDVREPGEVESSGRIAGSILMPLGQVATRAGEVDPSKLIVVHCKGGYRSSIATSLLRRAGIQNLANLSGGFDAWKTAGLPAV